MCVCVCVLLIVIPGLLRLASHNPSFFFTPREPSCQVREGAKGQKSGEKKNREGWRREKKKGHEGGGRWRKVKKERAREKKKDRWRRKWYVTERWWRSKTTCRQTQTQRRKLRLSCRLFVRRTDGNTERKLHPEKINWLWKISTWSL